MKWKKGKPNKPGIWLIYTENKDYMAAIVKWREPDIGKKHLAIEIDNDIEVLRDAEGILKSFGPIPDGNPSSTK
jgi:hypothetical protein